MMEQQKVPAAVCFNKDDLVDPEEADRLRNIYVDCGYRVFLCSAEKERDRYASGISGRKDHGGGRPVRRGKIVADEPFSG